jgi:ribosomal protein S18 acetylase RimI-like enzyme
MGLTYFKRFRMEIELSGRDFSQVQLPLGYSFAEWSESLTESHAEAKYLSFRGEIDSNVFPCLGEHSGCIRLMHEIRHKEGFLAGATWLVRYHGAERSSLTGQHVPEPCGTIQGIRDHSGMGAIQNLGIVPEHRSHGLGTALMHKALAGFQRAGLQRAFLEVTAQNHGAIRLYQRIGFSKARTVYKAVEVAYT